MRTRRIGKIGVCAVAAATCLPALADDDTKAASGAVGEEVDSICFQRNINGWRHVEGEDNVVLLEKGVNNWYRVELIGACDERVFRFAQSIAIDSRPGGSCVHRGDEIIVEDTPGFSRRCTIKRMYEWNKDAAAEDDADEGES